MAINTYIGQYNTSLSTYSTARNNLLASITTAYSTGSGTALQPDFVMLCVQYSPKDFVCAYVDSNMPIPYVFAQIHQTNPFSGSVNTENVDINFLSAEVMKFTVNNMVNSSNQNDLEARNPNTSFSVNEISYSNDMTNPNVRTISRLPVDFCGENGTTPGTPYTPMVHFDYFELNSCKPVYNIFEGGSPGWNDDMLMPLDPGTSGSVYPCLLSSYRGEVGGYSCSWSENSHSIIKTRKAKLLNDRAGGTKKSFLTWFNIFNTDKELPRKLTE